MQVQYDICDILFRFGLTVPALLTKTFHNSQCLMRIFVHLERKFFGKKPLKEQFTPNYLAREARWWQ